MVAIGIDLGTTNSCVGVLEGKNVKIIETKAGKRTVPSIVTYTESEVFVGDQAEARRAKFPKHTVYESKRLIGQNYDNEKVQNFISHCSYQLVNSMNMVKIKVPDNGQEINISPEEVSSNILKELKTIAEDYLGETVTKAVITVPAYFSENQRSATIHAASLVDFEEVETINEPTAAAIAFQFHNPSNEKRNIVIYDFGGGTFDVTIATVEGMSCTVVATDGDCFLGGTDVDMNLIDYLAKDIVHKHGLGYNGMKDRRRLKKQCEELKINLKNLEEYELELELSSGTYTRRVTRKDFEDLNDEIFNKTMIIVQNCLMESKLSKCDIDYVVLVGGSSRIPKIEKMLGDYFGAEKIRKTINPDEAVAYGAAIFAAQNFDGFKGIDIQDVLSLSLGYENDCDTMRFLITKNTPVPCTKSQTFQTTQNFLSLKLYQGESLVASKNFFLAQLSIATTFLKNQVKAEVVVTFEFDKDATLTVTAKDHASNKETNLKIDMTKHRCDESTVMRMVTEAKMNMVEEQKYLKLLKRKQVFNTFCEDMKLKTKKHRKRKDIFYEIYKSYQLVETLTPDEEYKIDELEQKIEKIAKKRSFFGIFKW